jgi:hypothetical protein
VDGRELDAMYRGLLDQRDSFLGVALRWSAT